MSWGRFLARRMLSLLLVLVVASLLVYGSLYLAPGGPLAFLVGTRSATPELIAQITAQYHLNDPFLVRYANWLSDVVHGDLGRSLVYREAETSLIISRIPTTLLLVIYSTILILVIGLGTGIWGALRQRTVGRAVTAWNVAFLSTPAFVLGALLILVFALKLAWFPVYGPGSGVLDRLWHLTLPAVALAMSSAAYLSRISGASINAELMKEHVETAFSRGLPRRLVIRRHVLRNASIPVITVVGLTIAGLVAGTVVVENVFALDGLGSLLVRAILQRDYAVVQAVVLLLAIVFVLVNLVVDVLYSFVDPRISLDGGAQ